MTFYNVDACEEYWWIQIVEADSYHEAEAKAANNPKDWILQKRDKFSIIDTTIVKNLKKKEII